MWFSVLFLVFTINFASAQLNDTRNSYILRFDYLFREEKYPEFIIGIISEPAHNVTVKEIITLTNLQNYSLNQTLDLLQQFNRTNSTNFVLDNLEYLLNITGLSFGNFYDSFRNRLNLSGALIMTSIDDLQVDKAKFSGALTFELYNMFDVLKNGTYSPENINKATKNLNKTLDEIFAATRDIILDELYKLERTVFFQRFNLNTKTMLRLWDILEIGKNQVEQVPKVIYMVNEYMRRLNKNSTIGIAIGKYQLVTLKSLYDEWLNIKHVVRLFAYPLDYLQPPYEVIGFEGLKGKNIAEFAFYPAAQTYINVTYSYNISSENCTYINVFDNETLAETVQVSDNQIVRSGETVFRAGSPLICNQKLYALAGKSDERTISFERFFYLKDNGVDSVGVKSDVGKLQCSVLLLGGLISLLFV